MEKRLASGREGLVSCKKRFASCEEGMARILCNERKKSRCYAHLKRVDITYKGGACQVTVGSPFI